MPYVYILEQRFDDATLPSQFKLSVPISTKDAAESKKNIAINIFKCQHGQVVELHMPANIFMQNFQKGTFVSGAILKDFLALNDEYSEKHVRKAANLLIKGMSDNKSPLHKLSPELGANVAAFFGSGKESLSGKAQKHIEKKLMADQQSKDQGKNQSKNQNHKEHKNKKT